MTTKPEPIPDNIVELIDGIAWLQLYIMIFLFIISVFFIKKELSHKKRTWLIVTLFILSFISAWFGVCLYYAIKNPYLPLL